MNKGFSLVELIVVIAIMAILVGVAVPVYTSYISKAEDGVNDMTIDEVERAITTLLIDQDVANPTLKADVDESEKPTIVLSSAGVAYNDNTEGAAFLEALNGILPGVKLEGTETVSFFIDGYKVTRE